MTMYAIAATKLGKRAYLSSSRGAWLFDAVPNGALPATRDDIFMTPHYATAADYAAFLRTRGDDSVLVWEFDV